MKVLGDTLAAEYERAIARWPFLHQLEEEHELPAFLLAAMGSRETNLGPEFTEGATGDGGHGHGVMQLDDRWHTIPPGFDLDARAQFTKAAEMMAGLLAVEDGELLPALNRYNSGSPETIHTAGKDYGPDVIERMEHLAGRFSATAPGRTKEVVMFMFKDPRDGRIWLFCGKDDVTHVPGPQDLRAFQKIGVPLADNTTQEWAEAVVPEATRRGLPPVAVAPKKSRTAAKGRASTKAVAPS